MIRDFMKEWLIFALGAIATYQYDIMGYIVLLGVLYCVDFAVGSIASLMSGEYFKSYKFRWSVVKLAFYICPICLTLIIGVCLGRLDLFMPVVKLQIYAMTYIEAFSIVENLQRIYPTNIFIRWLHYMLAAKWATRIKGLKDIMKEDKH